MTVVSIIICTCNRADHLRETLASLSQVCVPDDLPAELIVVDNASTDDTARVVQECRLPNMLVRYIHEPRRGQCYARNTGIAAAKGDVILFTDDDVRPPKEWIDGMCRPILEGKADAVAGGVKIAAHLERPWMTIGHRSALASTDRLDQENPKDMVGANMAFSRSVLEFVPFFDTELGPGAFGFGDETLFSWQLKRAGLSLTSALNVVVEHHFESNRLLRRSFAAHAEKSGRTQAYLAYHWHHADVRHPALYLAKRTARLNYWRVLRWSDCRADEGIMLWEHSVLMDIAYYRQYLIERKRSRNYEKNGLVKLNA